MVISFQWEKFIDDMFKNIFKEYQLAIKPVF